MKPKATTSRAWVDYAERRYYFARFIARTSIRGTSGIIRFHARVSATAFLKARLTAAERPLPETDSACALLVSCLDLEPRWQRYASLCHDLDEAAELIGYPGDVTTLRMARAQLTACGNLRRAARRRLGISA